MKIINRPIEDVDELAEQVFWWDDWGEKPTDKQELSGNIGNLSIVVTKEEE